VLVDVTLLGVVRAEIDGRPIPLPPLSRAVLARLALTPGRVVAIQTLIDGVWGIEPPASARTRVHAVVSSLRRTLADHGVDDLVVSRAPGYLLRADAVDIDLRRFDERCQAARLHLAANRPQAAAQALTEAAGVWSGTALDGIDCPFAETARAELDERRLRAIEERVGLDLDLRDPDDLVAELTGLVAAHPLRERLRGQLMTALNRAGRQADALDSYRTYLRFLDETYGLAPGPELRALNTAILAAEPPAPVSPPAPSAAVVPAQLPLDLAGFVGRGAALAALDRAARAAIAGRSVGLVLLSGMGGVGKTALAVHWAHRVAPDFPGGQIFVNLRGFDPDGLAVPPDEALRTLLFALGVAPQAMPPDLVDLVGLYRSVLSGKRVLIVLDNARDADQIRPLLPGAAGCLVIATSRNLLGGLVTTDGAQPLVLNALSTGEALDLLARRLGPDRTSAEPGATDEIIARCARLPLALSIVAARAAAHPSFPLDALAVELRDARGGLDSFVADDATADVRAVFSWSYRRLSPPTATLFRLLGLQPGPEVTAHAAARLGDVPIAKARAALAELAQATLLSEHAPGRYAFHDLIRTYAAELAEVHHSATDRRDAIRRLLDHYADTAHAAALLLDPHRDPVLPAPAPPAPTSIRLTDREGALAWFTAEHRVLLAAVELAAANDFGTHTWRMAWSMVDFLDWQGHWPDFAVTQQAALDAAHRLSDRRLAAHAHRRLANAYTRLGQYTDAHAHLARADRLYADLGDALGRAYTLNDHGWVYEQQDQHRDALGKSEEALAMFRAAGDVSAQAWALNNIGWLYTKLADYQQGIVHCRRALAMSQQIGDRAGEAAAWDSLGYAHHCLRDHQEAAACFRHALALWRQLGDRGSEAEALIHIGDAHEALDDPASAQEAWRHALVILEQLDHPDAQDLRKRISPADPGSSAAAAGSRRQDVPGR
jgi:DNA-binding SARP family transcriptional activator/tetratricopeptide (TPR) repeat protein